MKTPHPSLSTPRFPSAFRLSGFQAFLPAALLSLLLLPALAPSARAQINLNTGSLRITSTADLVNADPTGWPISTNLLFNGDATDSGTLVIASGCDVVFDSSLTGSDNRLTLLASNYGSIYLESNATLTFSGNRLAGSTAYSPVYLNANSRLILDAAAGARYIFQSNTTSVSGGAMAVTGTGSHLEITNFLVQSNTAAVNGGGVFQNNGTTVFSSGTFLNNYATGTGGAFYTTAAGLNVTFNDVSFIGNYSANNNARSGAIGIISPNNNASININVNSGTSFIAGNSYGSGHTSNGITVLNSANFTTNLNIFTEDGATLDMLDPFYAEQGANNAACIININKTGEGTWALAGSSTINKQGGGNQGNISININEGTLYLYRASEQVNVPGMAAPVSTAAGNITLMAVNAATPANFTLAAGATLSVGGGNKITLSSPAQSAGQHINFDQGSTLTYDLAGALDAGLGLTSSSPLLSLISPGLNSTYAIATSGTFNFNLNFDTWVSGSYNLLYAVMNGAPYITTVGNGTAGTTTSGQPYLGFTNDDGDWQAALAASVTYGDGVTAPTEAPIFTVDDLGNLWVTFPGAAPVLANNVLTWTGANAGAGGWRGTGNWLALGADAKFGTGDIVNLADNAALVSGSINVEASSTVGGMYVSGIVDYTITGAAIVATSASVGVSFDPAVVQAASGKLVVGGSASDDGLTYATSDTTPGAAYQGTLTLNNASNTFQNGIDIYSGALTGNAASLGVGASGSINVYAGGTLTFNQTASGTYTAPIAGSGVLNKAGDAALTLAFDNSAFAGVTNVNTGTLFLPAAASLGGAVNIRGGVLAGTGGATVGALGKTLTVGGGGIASPATLQVGIGGATGQTLNVGGDLFLDDGAILDFTDLNNNLLVAGAVSKAATGAFTINVSSTLGGTYNLIDATGGWGALTGDATSWLTLDYMGAQVTDGFTLSIVDSYLQLHFMTSALNRVITWNGSAGAAWEGANNWTASDGAKTFAPGDIVNLAGASPLDITLASTATVAAMYVAGAGSYTITGPGIVADANAGDILSSNPASIAASGKLVLGKTAASSAALADTPFSGVLDLAGITTSNTFTGGVDIYSGALRVSTTGQLGTTLSNLNFAGATNVSTGTLVVASGANLVYDGVIDNSDRLTIATGSSGAIYLENGAKLTISNNTSAAPVAISVGSGGSLVLGATGSGQYQFTDNTTTSGPGGIITVAGGHLEITNALFDSNKATANGGVISNNGAGGVVKLTNSTIKNQVTTGGNGGLFIVSSAYLELDSVDINHNTGNQGAVAFITQTGTLTINSSVFSYNTATSNGGVFFANTAGATLTMRDTQFDNNVAWTNGGVLYVNTANAVPVISATNVTFTSNTASNGNGGVFDYPQGGPNITLTNFSFLDNYASGKGGAIYIVANAASTLNLNAQTGVSFFSGNMEGATPNSIHYEQTTANAGRINIDVSNGAVLDMLDPLELVASIANASLVVSKTDTGAWNLAGTTTGMNTGAGAIAIAVNQGTLHLYAAGEHSASGNGDVTSAGNISFAGSNANGGSANYFTLAANAALSVGGGNTISMLGSGAAPASSGTITFAQGSLLSFDLANYASIGGLATAGAGPAMLNLTTASLNLYTSDSFNFGLDLANVTGASTYNLIYTGTLGTSATTANTFTDLGINDATGLLFYNDLVTGIDDYLYTYTTGITNDMLWITIASRGDVSNNVLTWAGATSSWRAADSWNTHAATSPTPAPYTKGDIINLAGAGSPDINVDTTTTATIAGMYVSGNQSYTLTGTSIVASTDLGTFTGSAAATGKLILGAIAADDGDSIDTTSPASAFTGALTLANSANNFTGGIDILTGALVATNAATLAAGGTGIYVNTGATLEFNQAAAPATFTGSFSGAGAVNKTGTATLTLAGNNSAFAGMTTVNAGALIIAAPLGGNATVNANSTLRLGATLGGNVTVNADALLGNSAGAASVTGNVTIAGGGALMVGENTAAAAQTFAIGGALTLDSGATLFYNLFDNGSDKITAATLDILGSGTIDINTVKTGTYTLVDAANPFNAATITNADALTITNNGAAITGRVTAHGIVDTANNNLLLSVNVTNISGTWTGANGSLWNTTAENWINPDDALFNNGDAATFAPVATATITVAENITAAAMTVDTTAGDLTFDGASTITTTTNATVLTAADTGAAFGKLVKQGAGALTFANTTGGGANSFEQGIDILDGAVIGSADNLRTSGTVTLAAATSNITFNQATAATYTAPITGPGSLTKTGAGNLTLDAVTDYTGATTLEAGALTLTRANQIQASSTVTLNAGTLLIGANDQILNNLNGAGNITGDGALTINSTGLSSNFLGAITTTSSVTVNGGDIVFAGNNTASSFTVNSGDITLGGNNTASSVIVNSGTLTLLGSNAISGTVTIASGALVQLGIGLGLGSVGQAAIVTANNSALILDHGAANFTLDNALSGAGLITKATDDTGLLTLTANSTAYTGTTQIQAGTLALAPDASLGGQVNLSATTSLAGSGTLHNVTTLGAATITVGALNNPLANGPETLALTGTLALAGPTTLNYDIYSENSSDLITAAALVRSGSDTFNINLGSFTSGTYTLITTTETLDATATAGLGILSNGNALSERATADFVIDAGASLNLILISHNLPNLVWDGTNSGLWQHNQTNWEGGNVFLNGDAVTFDNTLGGTNAVTVDTAGVLTRAMTVNSGTFTFTGGGITTSATAASSLAAGDGDGKLTIAPGASVTLSNTTGGAAGAAGANFFESGITIAAGASLTGNTETLVVGADAGIANAGSLTFNQAATAAFDNAITGPGSITKTGAGALTLTNAAYATGLNVGQGSLTLADNAVATRGDITIATGATLNIATSAASYTIQNTLAGAGALNISLANPAPAPAAPALAAAAALADSVGPVNFATVPAAFTGTLALGLSTFDLSGNNTAALANATLRLNAGNATTVGSGTQTIGALSLNGGKIDFTEGALQVSTLTIAAGASGTVQVTIPLSDELAATDATLFAQATGTSLARLVAATGSVAGAANAANLVLIDQNGNPVTATATSNITQNGVAVATAAYSHSLDATGGLNVKYGLTSLTVLDGETLALAPSPGESGVFSATIAGSGNITIDASATAVTFNKANTAYTGAITLLSGTLSATAAGAFGGTAATLTQLAATTLNTGAYAQSIASLSTDAGATTNIATGGTLSLAKGGAINGALTGAGALAAAGGELIIAGANTAYTGAVTIGASGTLTLGDFQALNTRPIANAGVLNIDTAASGTLANPLTGAGVLNLNGADTITIATTNTMTGPVNVNGSVVATRSGALGTGPIAITGALAYTSGTLVANALSGTGTLSLSSASITITGNNSHFAGAINVLPGALVTVSTNPNALHSASLNIDTATVVLAINNAILGNATLANGASLAFATANPGNLATLAGLNGSGTLSFNTNVGTFGNSDTLIVTGPANGAFDITINNTGTAPFGGSSTRTLVDARAGGSATYNGSGTLDKLGLYLYDWNVESANGSAILNVTQQAAFNPAGGAIIANAIGVLPLTWFSELDTLHKRLGDLNISTRSKPGVDLWMRAYTQRLDVNDKSTPVPFTETQYGTEVGADYGGLANADGLVAYLGAFAGYGSSSRDLDMTGVNGDTTSVHAGAYAAFIAPGGWYVDLVGKFNNFKNTFTANFDGNQSMNASYTTSAFGGSVEFGKRIGLNRHLWLTPSAQAALARIESAEYTTGASQPSLCYNVTQESASSRQLRAGFLLGYKVEKKDGQLIQPYASVHFARQWTSGGAVLIQGRDSGAPDGHGPYYSIIEGNRLEAGLGVNWQLRKNLQLYLDYDCAWARDYKKPYGFNLGANYQW